jgi:hypothetical protein
MAHHHSSAEVEQLIMDQQKVHFGQATPTPFTNEPLKSTFNLTGTSPEVDLLLNCEKAPLLHVHPQLNQIRQSCTQKMPPIFSVILLAEMKQKYSTWNKTTSTSPPPPRPQACPIKTGQPQSEIS